ncbi:MAG: penicillin-insensitive murein endopeptidase [Fluviicola sp.]
MKYTNLLLLLFGFAFTFACAHNAEKQKEEKNVNIETQAPSATAKYYQSHVNDSLQSKSIGTVANGRLEHATLIPFKGKNFSYFDVPSYLGGRAFANNRVIEITQNTYQSLLSQGVDRHFKVMEFSHKNGGKMYPHRTHQNGLSVDYMMPLKKDGKPYYGLDDIGASHYLLDFDTEGRYTKDKSVSIDFNLAARHILELDKQARKKGMRIHKVIFNTHLKDELYASNFGKELKSSGIYITRNLSKLINDLHDDHYHVDFIEL